MSNLNVLGAFVASALAIVDLDGKIPASFRDLTFFTRNLFRIFHPPSDFFSFFSNFFFWK